MNICKKPPKRECYGGFHFIKAFDKLIMKSAEATLSKYTDTDGYPIYGRVAVVMQTMYIPTKNDMENWFGF
jgi:hypothetical protein